MTPQLQGLPLVPKVSLGLSPPETVELGPGFDVAEAWGLGFRV